jgi:hypothetical protein
MTYRGDREWRRARHLAEDARQREWRYPSFAAELFRGSFRWTLLSPLPHQPPNDVRVGDAFIEKVRQVLEEYIDPNEVDRTEEVPQEALLALAEIGCFGMRIPKPYGGLGFSHANFNRVMSFIASYCMSTAAWLAAHQSIGAPEPLLLFGTQEQKEKFLPRIAKGALTAFAMTEPGAGSDPARMTSTARPDKDGGHYLLNGEKLWCTNGPNAEYMIVLALTPPRMVDGEERPQVTAFIVETDVEGFEVAHHCSFMGIRGVSNGLIRFTNVAVPKENVIGAPGQGLHIALTLLNTGRLIMPAMASAASKVALHHTFDWCHKRVQWGAAIGEHQMVGDMASRMAAGAFAIDSINRAVSALADQGGSDIRIEAAMANYFCSEMAWRICDDFVQVRGGRGYETAESLANRGESPVPAERLLRDIRVARLVEGTTEVMCLCIAREAIDAHLRRLAPIYREVKKPSGRAWRLFREYAGWYTRQWTPHRIRSMARRLTTRNRNHLRFVERTSRRLARAMFYAVARYREKLEREQLVVRALVDVGAALFAMSASLARVEQAAGDGKADAESMQHLVDHFCRMMRRRIQEQFEYLHVHDGNQVRTVAEDFLNGRFRWVSEGIYTKFPPQFQAPTTMEELLELLEMEEPMAPVEREEEPTASSDEPFDLVASEEAAEGMSAVEEDEALEKSDEPFDQNAAAETAPAEAEEQEKEDASVGHEEGAGSAHAPTDAEDAVESKEQGEQQDEGDAKKG